MPNPRKIIFEPSATRRLSLAAWTLAAALGALGVRLGGIGWERADRWEKTIGMAGRRIALDRSPYGRALDVVLLVLVPAAGAALAVWLGARWRRGERRLPAACLLAVAGAVLTTELLKLVLARRAGVPEQLAEGYPSGHTTGAFATALAYLVAARGRPPTALAAPYVALVAAGVVLDGWHLPSDALGAIFVASAWLFGALALLDPPRTSHRVTAGDAAAALVLTALVVVLLLAHPGVPAHARLVRQSAEAAGGLAAAALVAVLAVYAIAVRSASTTRS